MQTMKRIHHVLAAAAVFVSAAVLVSCAKAESSIDEITQLPEDTQTVTFTATLAPKGEDPSTKAITTGKDGDNKEILNVAWKAGEEIAVYYETTSGHATTTATVESVDSETGAAIITATFAADAKDNGEAKFVFPASLHNGTGDIDEAALLSQNGNLTGANGISTKFDAATCEGTITVSGSEASVSGTVTMTNRVCICKFHFDIVDGVYGPARNFSPIIIRDDNGHTYTITSDRDDGIGGSRGFNRDDDVYIALLPVSGKTVTFYTKYSNHYLFTASGTTLTAGKFYRNLSINMAKDDSGLCDKYKDLRDGSITASDGDIIYQRVNTSATSNTITILDGATVTLAGVNINATASAGITCSGSANIILEGTNSVTTSASNYPGIQAGGSTTTLTISGRGSLSAVSDMNGAGIGSGYGGTCGDIVINSGTISAISQYGAAIGCGQYATCGNISINGGTVHAIALAASGIGGSTQTKFNSLTIGSGISSVTAQTTGFSGYFVPIGKGYLDQGSGTVTVDGVADWAGAETEHLNFAVSTTTEANDTWTLTHK